MAIHTTRVRALLTAGILSTVLGTGTIVGAAYPAIAETVPTSAPTDPVLTEPPVAPAPRSGDNPDLDWDECPDLLSLTVTDITDTSFVLHWTVDPSVDYTSFELFAGVYRVIAGDGSSSYDLPLEGFMPGSNISVEMRFACSTHPLDGGASLHFTLTGDNGEGGPYSEMAVGFTNSSASAAGFEDGEGETEGEGAGAGGEGGSTDSPGTSSADPAAGSASSTAAGSAALDGTGGVSDVIPNAPTDSVDPAATPITATPAALAQTGSQTDPTAITSGLLLVSAGAVFFFLAMRPRARS